MEARNKYFKLNCPQMSQIYQTAPTLAKASCCNLYAFTIAISINFFSIGLPEFKLLLQRIIPQLPQDSYRKVSAIH